MQGKLIEKFDERMGSTTSKVKHTGKKIPWRRNRNSDDNEKQIRDSELAGDKLAENDIERIKLKALRQTIKDTPNIFILNNLVLSIQLFENYEKDIEKAREELTRKESALNKKLQPYKKAVMPDVLREHFNGRIRFTSYCKSDKDEQTVEPLRPIQIYIVYENVLVTEHEEIKHYDNPDDINVVDYTFVLKEANHKGYARLEEPSTLTLRRAPGSDNTDLSSIAENQDEIYSDESIYGPIGKRQNGTTATRSMPDLLDEDIYYEEENAACSTNDLMKKNNGRLQSRISRQRNLRFRPSKMLNSASSSSSGYTTNNGLDSDSDSSGTSRFNGSTHNKKPHSMYNGKQLNTNLLTSKCFKRIIKTRDGRIYNPRKEQQPSNSLEKRIRDENLKHNYTVVYVNGYEVAKNFYTLFRDQLAEKMNFDEKAVNNAKQIDSTVRLEEIHLDYTSHQDTFISIDQYEVIPCFSSPWPKWARNDWVERNKNWPRYEDLQELSRFNCHLVPESLRTEIKRQRKLDWNLNYPIAERYLETCLSDAQASVYAIALMMHKVFIRTINISFGLDIRHIRHMLFWMAEDVPNWSELEMGKYLLDLLISLHLRIQKQRLCDYFIEERNLFANVIIDDLQHSQKQLQRIIENPVMFVFHTLEKIHYERDDLPRLDYKELYRLLTVNEILVINRNLANEEINKELKYQLTSQASSNYGKREFWNVAKQTDHYIMKTRKRSMNTYTHPRRTEDSIIDIHQKCEPLTRARLSGLLKFFAEHFLEMAHCCHNLGIVNKKRIYLEQTRLLSLLLADDPKFEAAAEELLEKVRQSRDNLINLTPNSPEELPPKTPKRNADAPIFQRTLKDRFGYATSEDFELHNNNSNSVTVQAEVNPHIADKVETPKSALHSIAKSEKEMTKLKIDDSIINSVETTTF